MHESQAAYHSCTMEKERACSTEPDAASQCQGGERSLPRLLRAMAEVASKPPEIPAEMKQQDPGKAKELSLDSTSFVVRAVPVNDQQGQHWVVCSTLCRNLGVSFLVTGPTCIASALTIAILAIPCWLFSKTMNPAWSGSLMAVSFLSVVVAIFGAEEFASAGASYTFRVLANFTALFVSVVAYISISVAFCLVANPWPNIFWLILVAQLSQWVVEWSLLLCSPTYRQWAASTGMTPRKELIVNVSKALIFSTCCFVISGAAFGMRYFAGRGEPVKEFLSISIAYPVVRIILRMLVGKLDTSDKENWDLRVKNDLRTHIMVEIAFAMPSLMAASLLSSWRAFFIFQASNMFLELCFDMSLLSALRISNQIKCNDTDEDDMIIAKRLTEHKQLVRLRAGFFADQLNALLAPIMAGLVWHISMAFCRAQGLDVSSLEEEFPGWTTLVARVFVGLAQELLTEVVKGCAYPSLFGIYPQTGEIKLHLPDVSIYSCLMGFSSGTFMSGLTFAAIFASTGRLTMPMS